MPTSPFVPSIPKPIIGSPLYNDASLVSYWQFEGNSNDSKGSNNGTDTTISYSATAGKFNQGASFTANTSRISLGDPTNLKFSSSHTLNAWINLLGTNRVNLDQIFFKGNDGVDFSCITLYWSGANTIVYGINANRTLNARVECSGTITVDSNWHMVTAKYTGSAIYIYWDGVQIATANTSITIDTTDIWYIGNTNGNRSVNKYIDDVSMFNRALSADEIAQLYGTTKAYYKLDGNSNDSSGKGNNGTDTSITYSPNQGRLVANFNGSSSKIVFGTTGMPIGNAPRTWSAWVKKNATSVDVVFSSGGGGGSTDTFGLFINDRTLYGWGVSDSATTGVIKLNTWNHCAVVYDGTNQIVYLNGNVVGTFAKATINTAAGNVGVGANIGAGSNFFNGSIDEVIIESRAWSPAEVKNYYRRSSPAIIKKGWLANIVALILQAQAGVFTLTGKAVAFNTTLNASKGTFSLIGKLADLILTGTVWTNIVKSVSSWTNKTKTDTTWTSQNKNDTDWTNITKS